MASSREGEHLLLCEMVIVVSEKDCSPDAAQIFLVLCCIKLWTERAPFILEGNAFQKKNCL